eukprot:3457776-Amphidinium_carterae.1
MTARNPRHWKSILTKQVSNGSACLPESCIYLATRKERLDEAQALKQNHAQMLRSLAALCQKC